MSSKSKSRQIQAGNSAIEDLQGRVIALEAVIKKLKVVIPSDEEVQTCVDIKEFVEEWKTCILLKAFYPPQEDSQTVYELRKFAMNRTCSGYWPTKRNDSYQRTNWNGIYLGGCEQMNEMRRAVTIPFCVKQSFDFYNPQGLTYSEEDCKSRKEALDTCGSAIIDMTGDELCLNYSLAMDFIYLVAHGFLNIHVIQLPENIPMAALKFDAEDKLLNVVGPFDNFTMRERRVEYYETIKFLVEEFQYISQYPGMGNNGGLGSTMISKRETFRATHTENILIKLNDRIQIYRNLCMRSMNCDISILLRISFGMFLLCELRSRQAMDDFFSEWRTLLGEYRMVCLKMEADAQLLLETPSDQVDDNYYHMQACIDFFCFVKCVVGNCRHLDI